MENSTLDEPARKKYKSANGVAVSVASNTKNGGTNRRIKVGSRKSQLALFQTNFVVDLLRNSYANYIYDIITMTTIGDKILDVALSKIGEKSLFTKELEIALENREVNMVVHSLKDLPTSLPPGMVIGAICKRENPFDVVVFSPEYNCKELNKLPKGSVVGTSSLRRIAQLKRVYPGLIFQSIRGNLNTRLRKLDEDKTYAALILAAAGLIRLDLTHRIVQTLSPTECMYAVGQGALAIECQQDDNETLKLLSKISDRDTTLCCIAERAFMKAMEGGCSVPIAVQSSIDNDTIMLQGGVFSLDGSKSIIESITDCISSSKKEMHMKEHYAGIVAPHIPSHVLYIAENLGIDLANLLLEKGAADILKEARMNNVILPKDT